MPSPLPMPEKFPALARRLHAASLLLALAAPAWAQNKALDLARDPQVNLPPSVREDLSTIGRYAETVNRKLNPGAGAPAAPPPASAAPPASGAERAPGARRMDALSDPFEVSPQLRENRRPSAGFGGLPTATKLDLRRRVQVKAVLITPQGRAAQLEVDGRHTALGARAGGEPGAGPQGDMLTVMDGELVDFGDLGTYVVRISAREGVTLSNPGNPQTGRITLR
ncbi:MAG: hypothetical protein ACT4NV_12335 [Rhodoferax sp.]